MIDVGRIAEWQSYRTPGKERVMTTSNVNLRQLRAFIAVADKGSFVKASQVLNISQPALSQSIRQLEAHVGSPLFNRTTRLVHMTPLGISFLPLARDLIHRFDSLMADVQSAVQRKHGNVTVACLPSVAARLMPRVLVLKERLFPGIHVTIRDSNMKGVASMILSGEAEIGIGSGQAPHADLASSAFARDRMYAVLPVTSALARKRSLQWKELEGQAFIAMSHETGIRELVDGTLEDVGVAMRPISEISNLATLGGLVEEGLGMSVAPELALPRDSQAMVRRRPLTHPVVHRSISLFWKRGQSLSPAASGLLNALDACIADGEMSRHLPDVEWDRDALQQVLGT